MMPNIELKTSRIMIAGPSSCGKTVLSSNIIDEIAPDFILAISRTIEQQGLFDLRDPRTPWRGNSKHSCPCVMISNEQEGMNKIRLLIDKQKRDKAAGKMRPVLVFLDDISGSRTLKQPANYELIDLLYSCGRHFLISIMFLVQNLTDESLNVSWRRNANRIYITRLSAPELVALYQQSVSRSGLEYSRFKRIHDSLKLYEFVAIDLDLIASMSDNFIRVISARIHAEAAEDNNPVPDFDSVASDESATTSMEIITQAQTAQQNSRGERSRGQPGRTASILAKQIQEQKYVNAARDEIMQTIEETMIANRAAANNNSAAKIAGMSLGATMLGFALFSAMLL